MPKFTDRFLKGLKVEPGSKDRLVFDALCPGLGVRVTAKGTRAFLAQWTDPATKRKVREPLGVWGNLTIDKARDAARARLGQVAKDINPRAERLRLKQEAERERAETALSFDALVTEWATLHLENRSERYRAEAQRAIRHTFAALLRRPAARITRTEAVNALDGLVHAGNPAMAGRTLAYARAAFRWAQKRGKVAGNPFQDVPIATATAARERVLSDGELAEVWSAAAAMGYPWGPFFQLVLLTLQRREAVAGMCWSEVADDLTTWRIPGHRQKNGKPHDVHLSDAARGVLRGLKTETEQRDQGDAVMALSDFVFTTTGDTAISGFSKAKAALDEAVQKVRAEKAAKLRVKPVPFAPWWLHDLRRSGVSALARLGFDSIVADKLLAHQPAKLQGVAAVYQRYDFGAERARALDAWAAHVLGTAGGNVMPFAPRSMG